MKKFLLQSLFFSSILFFCAVLFDLLYSRKIQESVGYVYESWFDVMQGNINADIIINGSSRAWVMVSPQILDSVLHIKSYNIGIDGGVIDKQIVKYNLFRLNNCKPQLVIQNVDYFTIGLSSRFQEEQFFPYFLNTKFRKNVFPTVHFSLSQKYIPAYRYYGQVKNVWIDKNQNIKCLYKGFQAQEREWDGTNYSKIDSIIFHPNEHAEIMFDKYLSNIIQDSVKVIFVYAPIYIGVTNKMTNLDEMYAFYKKYADKYDIPILDYNYMDICYDTTYFYNATHLNKRGAEIYSKALAEDIRNLGILQ